MYAILNKEKKSIEKKSIEKESTSIYARACVREKRSFKFMGKNYKELLDKLKPYENECNACKSLVKRLERHCNMSKPKNRLKSGCEVIYK